MEQFDGRGNRKCLKSLVEILAVLMLKVLLFQEQVDADTTVAVSKSNFGLIFNGSSQLQNKLHLSALLGFRDAGLAASPVLVDISKDPSASLSNSVDRVVESGASTFVSLLETEELDTMLLNLLLNLEQQDSDPIKPIRVILPRDCTKGHVRPLWSPLVRIECFWDDSAAAVALLHHISKSGVTNLIPLADGPQDQDQLQLHIYKSLTGGALTNHKSTPPASTVSIMTPCSTADEVRRVLIQSHRLYPNETRRFGILALSKRKELVSAVLRLTWETQQQLQLPYLVRTFSPWGVTSIPMDALVEHGVPHIAFYAVEYGGRPIENVAMRRRLLNKLSGITGPDPLICRAKATFEVVKDVVVAATEAPYIETKIQMKGQGTFYGFSLKPSSPELAASFLQPSKYVLEDVTTVSTSTGSPAAAGSEVTEEISVSAYKVATSTILPKEKLTTISLAANSKLNCLQHTRSLIVTAFDPFNEQPYKYRFKSLQILAEYLVIPNQFGFGLEFSCIQRQLQAQSNGNSSQEGAAANEISLRIACMPNENSLPVGMGPDHGHGHVHCFRSNFNIYNNNGNDDDIKGRPRRRRQYPNVYYAQPRDDTSYQAPPAMPNSYSVPTSPMGYTGAPASASTDVDMTTTEEPAPTTTPAPPPPPPAKLPDVRMILKAGKPFVGACIGASMGCASCVIVLGRLPLTAVPAICSGPCFVTTFGQCGALLGYVGSTTTVICTELFKQGYLDVETFIADAEFGRQMERDEPITLKGYQVLATPLVRLMQASPTFTAVVSKFGVPWAKYMQSTLISLNCEAAEDVDVLEDGDGDADIWFGGWITWVGAPLCKGVGYMAMLVERLTISASVASASVPEPAAIVFYTALLIPMLISLLCKIVLRIVTAERKV